MTVRPTAVRFTASLLAFAVLAACGDDDADSDSTPAPVAAATVRIDAVVSASGDSFQPGDAETSLDLPCNGAIVVRTTTENWLLRSPSGCGTNTACGALRVSAQVPGTDTRVVVSSLAQSTLLRLEAPEFSGPTLLTVELLGPNGEPYSNAGGNPVVETVELGLSRQPSCDAAADGGS